MVPEIGNKEILKPSKVSDITTVKSVRAKTELMPHINSGNVFGVRQNAHFFYTIAAGGQRPLKFFCENLPQGLKLDSVSGIITGSLNAKGKYEVLIGAENMHGINTRKLHIAVGKEICLTPPMGWNSWNCWGDKIDQQKIRQTADLMVSSGLINHGWTYVNIDDGWQGQRDSSGALQPNEKFPDMNGLCDYVHSLGLKIGIYSAPWTKTFAGYTGGSSGKPRAHIRDEKKGWYVGEQTFEEQDAKQWAQWGIDYLKYDWHPMDLASGRRMQKVLENCGRNIIYSVTNSIYHENAAEWAKIAQCFFLWRTLDDVDITDTWESVSSIGFRMGKWRQYVSPGHWNDPDMLVLGTVGWGEELKPTRLTEQEQYTHFSLWCLLAAPLLLGCDLKQLDAFTLKLLTNDEVIAVNQDSLGNMALCVSQKDNTEVWAKKMNDDSLAVGLFNRDDNVNKTIMVKWSDLGLSGKCLVRDLWRHKDIGIFSKSFLANVDIHGVMLVKIKPLGETQNWCMNIEQ